jgi:dTDP-glucose 4,6-dehydratase
MISKEHKFIEEDIERVIPKLDGGLEKLRDQSILITGASGFLGTWLFHLIYFLNKNQKMNINLFALDRDFYNFKEKYYYLLNSKNITIIESDVRSTISISNDIDYIIHAASTPDRRMHTSSPLDTMTSIAEGTSSLLKLSNRLPNLKMFLNMSASSVYDQSDLRSIDEISPGKPLSQNISYAHAEAKRFAEMLCSAARSEARIPMSTVRPFTFCGPFQDINAPWALNNFINDAINNSSINISGNGKTKRSYMYGLDFAVWCLTILVNTKSGKIYNIGSNEGISLKKLAKEIKKLANLSEDIQVNTSLLGQIKQDSLVPNVDAAINDFGLELFTDFEETIRRTFEWYTL